MRLGAPRALTTILVEQSRGRFLLHSDTLHRLYGPSTPCVLRVWRGVEILKPATLKPKPKTLELFQGLSFLAYLLSADASARPSSRTDRAP